MFISADGVAGSAPLRSVMLARGNAPCRYWPTRLRGEGGEERGKAGGRVGRGGRQAWAGGTGRVTGMVAVGAHALAEGAWRCGRQGAPRGAAPQRWPAAPPHPPIHQPPAPAPPAPRPLPRAPEPVGVPDLGCLGAVRDAAADCADAHGLAHHQVVHHAAQPLVGAQVHQGLLDLAAGRAGGAGGAQGGRGGGAEARCGGGKGGLRTAAGRSTRSAALTRHP